MTRTRYGATTTQPPVEAFSFAGYGHSLPLDGVFPHAITFLGLDGGTPPTPTPTITPTPATGSAIRGVGSGRRLDVTGASQANGAAVQIWDCNGQNNQRRTRT
ncbi:RICIN domain-containing protein [Streptosporangium sp. NPDC050280]|uniref:RICIN domain-containing protein n=1 Tax=unclassified Streptosporangium TaxID=2632669 RepID=UPI0034452805